MSKSSLLTQSHVVKVPDYDASERQSKFHSSQAYETLYGGAAGGGKTAAIVAEAITVCLEYPGIPVYIFRRSIPELKTTIAPEIRRQCADYISLNKLHYNSVDREWRFDNGSVIKLAYCDNPGDEYRYQGVEIPVLLIDEVTHFTRDQYEYLKTRVRTSNPDWPTKVMCATNPGNVGHGWVKEYWIDGKTPEQIYDDPETGRSRIFIPAKVVDHPIERFREDYKKTLQSIQDPELRRALLDGDWDVFAGQVFTEWRREKDGKPWHVVKPFQIPEHWPKWVGYDWGYNTYAGALWFTKDPQTQRKFIYREMYVSQVAVTKQAELIKSYDKSENIGIYLGDPAMWKSPANAETGETVAELFSKAGLYFQPANNDRIAGKNAWHEALSTAPDGLPWLQVFENCTNLIRTLPVLPYDDHKVEDVDTDAEDHLYDAGRYGLINERPTPSNKPKRVKHYDPHTGRLLS